MCSLPYLMEAGVCHRRRADSLPTSSMSLMSVEERRDFQRNRKRTRIKTASYVLSVFLLVLLSASPSSSSSSSSNSSSFLQFTHPKYHVSIPENSVGRVVAIPDVKMGIKLGPDASSNDVQVRFRIKSGDPDGFFKAESERVGDFVFLVLRTRTSTRDVLNRERTDAYDLDVRARIKRPGHKSRTRRDRRKNKKTLLEPEPRCAVHVTVTDTNDLDPFFAPSRYSFVADEDAPLHSAVGRVRATDADAGVNGAVYYSVVGEPGPFAVDPVTGDVVVTRPLDFKARPRHTLTLAARDRGAKPAYAVRRADTAEVHIQVKQVRIFKLLFYCILGDPP